MWSVRDGAPRSTSVAFSLLAMLVALGAGGRSAWALTWSARSQTLVRAFAKQREDEERTFVPAYQLIDLQVRDLGVRGLAVSLAGWGMVDLADLQGGGRAEADLSLLTLHYIGPRRRFQARAGRQFVYASPAAAIHLDGVSGWMRLPWGFEASAFGGVAVLPRFEGYRKIRPMVGGRVAWTGSGFSAGLAFLHLQEESVVSRQELTLDALFSHRNRVSIGGSVGMDLVDLMLSEARAMATWRPYRFVKLSLDYDHTRPLSFISRASIFSVFSTASYHQVGGDLWWRALWWASFSLGYHHYLFEQSETGMKASLRGRFTGFLPPPGAIGVDLHRMGEGSQGYWKARVFAVVGLFRGVTVGADLQVAVFDEPINGESTSLYGQLHAAWQAGRFRVTAAVYGGTNPAAKKEVAGVLKLTWLGGVEPRRLRGGGR